MVEVNAFPRIREQVWLVMGLRWRMFRNGLHGVSAKLSLVGTIIAGVLWSFIAFGIGIAIGLGGYFLLRDDRFDALGYLFWGLFLFWQLAPILASQFAAGFDSTGLLRFPLRFSSFFALHLSYGVADPVALTGVFWHVCLFAGLVMARSALAAQFALIVALSVLMNLLLSRMLFTWLERLLAQRRTREILFVLMMLFFLSVQFSGMLVHRWGAPLAHFFRASASFWMAFPPGQARAALSSFADGETALGLGACGVLTLYTAVFAVLLIYRLHGEFRGEYFGETAAPAARARKLKAPAHSATAASASPVAIVRAKSAQEIISGPVAAVFMKEIRYLFRNSMQLLNLVVPIILVAIFGMSWHNTPARAGAFRPGFSGASLAYPGAVAYAMLVVIQLFLNSFAYDSSGVQMLFLAPVKFREVMLGKNLFQAVFVAMEAVLVWVIVAIAVAPPPFSILLTTWAGLLVVAPISMAVGNWFSLTFPRRLEFGVRRQRMAGLSKLAFFVVPLIYFGTVAFLAAAAALVRWLVGLWLVPITFLAIGGAALWLYRVLLDETSQLAVKQRETLIQQLVR
ncbi:MAG TPA: hypothetical protein VN862_08590 [Candidatus Acidoferrales bacterium]|nr:hypothetical protein [Candidatus Acidoferrales bacterium]